MLMSFHSRSSITLSGSNKPFVLQLIFNEQRKSKTRKDRQSGVHGGFFFFFIYLLTGFCIISLVACMLHEMQGGEQFQAKFVLSKNQLYITAYTQAFFPEKDPFLCFRCDGSMPSSENRKRKYCIGHPSRRFGLCVHHLPKCPCRVVEGTGLLGQYIPWAAFLSFRLVEDSQFETFRAGYNSQSWI